MLMLSFFFVLQFVNEIQSVTIESREACVPFSLPYSQREHQRLSDLF